MDGSEERATKGAASWAHSLHVVLVASIAETACVNVGKEGATNGTAGRTHGMWRIAVAQPCVDNAVLLEKKEKEKRKERKSAPLGSSG